MPAARWSAGGTGSRPTPVVPYLYGQARMDAQKGVDHIVFAGADVPHYDVPAHVADHIYEERGVRTAPWRGIGAGATNFAIEVVIDELAQLAGQNPLAYRLALLKDPRAKTRRRDRGQDGRLEPQARGHGARHLVRQARAAADRFLADRHGGRGVDRPRQRPDQVPQSLVRGRRRPAGAARQRGGAGRELADLCARQRAQGADHDPGRRRAADRTSTTTRSCGCPRFRRSRSRSSAQATFRCRSASSAFRAWCRRSAMRCSR